MLIILGLAVNFLIPQITDIEESLSVIKTMTLWAIGLAILAQILSYIGNGYIIKSLLEVYHQKIHILKSALIYMSSVSTGLVAGGFIGSTSMIYKWLSQEEHKKSTATLVSIIPSTLNNIIIVLITIIGVTYLLSINKLDHGQFIEFSIILSVLLLVTVLIIIALHSQKTITNIILWIDKILKKLFHKSFSPEKIIAFIDNFYQDYNSIKGDKLRKPLLGAVTDVGFDILTLYFIFIAAGYNIPFEILLAGYGLPILLWKVAFIVPGGIGVVEATMLALYTSLDVPKAICVVVILVYRLISFWIPTILGFIGIPYLNKVFLSNKDK